jgi:addiction module RelE/StbE family toxin
MRIRWSMSALARLDEISDYIGKDNPTAAESVVREVFRRTALLASHPHLGRAGQISGTRELVIVGTPYIAVYRVTDSDVEILALFHGAQRLPGDLGGL